MSPRPQAKSAGRARQDSLTTARRGPAPRANPATSPEIEAGIREAMARALWVDAFAQWSDDDVDTRPRPRGGEDWDTVVPATPEAARAAARDLVTLFASAEGLSDADNAMTDLFALAWRVDLALEWDPELDPAAAYNAAAWKNADDAPTVLDIAHAFGSDLTMEALGHGVSWFDDHREESKLPDGTVIRLVISFPSFACHYDGRELSWYGTTRSGAAKTGTAVGHRRALPGKYVVSYFETVTPAAEDDAEPEVERGEEDETAMVVDEDAQAEGITAVDMAVEYLHDAGGSHLEPSSSSFHPGLWYSEADGNTNYQTGAVTTLSFHLEGFTADEEKMVYDRWSHAEWDPHPNSYGRVIVVNDRGIHDHRYVLWFGQNAPTFLMAHADSLDEATDECFDYIETHYPGWFADDLVEERVREVVGDDADDGQVDAARQQVEEELGVFRAGNHGRMMLGEDMGIAAEDPTFLELMQIAHPGRGPNRRRP